VAGGFSSRYRRIFGVGPVGILTTVLVWLVVYHGSRALGVPPVAIHPVLRWGLLIIFLLDALYLVGGGVFTLARNGWGQRLITTGPYQFIRHPLYSALIYSATGALGVWLYSWPLLMAVLPLALFWSWLVQKEEAFLLKKFGEEYRRYMARTGQFFPSFRELIAQEED
jgi:protein-S-isoprenylcysteine O-methyltransferase Ste14